MIIGLVYNRSSSFHTVHRHLFLRARSLLFDRRGRRVRVVLLAFLHRLDAVVEASFSQLGDLNFCRLLAKRTDKFDLIIKNMVLEADTCRMVPVTLVLTHHILPIVVLPATGAVGLTRLRHDRDLVFFLRISVLTDRWLDPCAAFHEVLILMYAPLAS